MPDDRSEPPCGAARYDESADVLEPVARARELKSLMAGAAADQAKKYQRQVEVMKYRVANQYWLQALDKALVTGLGLELKRFCLTNPPRPLASSERRYIVPVEGAEELLGAAEGGGSQCRRVGVENIVTKARWLEAPRMLHSDGKMTFPATLHLCIDRGSIGWPAALFFYTVLGGFGCLFADFAHDDWNALKNSAVGAGCWLPLLERVVVLNLPSGPWQGSAFFGVLQESFTSWWKSASAADPLFRAMYRHICQERQDFPLDFGSEEHIARVWRELPACRAFHRKGTRVRVGRWYAAFDAADEKDGELMIVLMVLLHIGLRDKYWSDLDNSPWGRYVVGGRLLAADSSHSVAPPGGRAVAAAKALAKSSSSKQSVSASNKELQKVRGDSQNTMDLVARILSNRLHFRIVEGLRYLVRPFHISFGRSLVLSRTKKGMLELYMEYALGVKNGVCMMEAWLQLKGGDGFHKIGFMSLGSKAEGSQVDEDSAVAEKLYMFVLNFIGLRIANHLQYMTTLPGCFVLLLHPSENVRLACLLKLQNLWARLTRAEVDAHANSFARSFLSGLVWPRFPWVRYVLITLSEYGFNHIPGHVHEAITQLFQGLLSTNVNELAMNLLRRKNSIQRRGVQSRKSRYHNLIASSLLQEHDRPSPACTIASGQAAAKSLPSTVFEADTRNFSCGMDQLSRLSSDKSWPSLNAEGWRLVGFAMLSWEMFGNTGNTWSDMRRVYLSLLLEPGVMFLPNGDASRLLLVLHATRWGCICWPMQHMKSGAFSYFVPCSPRRDEKYWEFVAITDIKKPKAFRIAPTPPCKHLKSVSTSDPPSGIVPCMEGKAMALPRLAAHRAFMPMTVEFLSDLVDELAVDLKGQGKPHREMDLVELLVRHVMPELSDSEVTTMLKLREKGKATADAESELLTAAGLDKASEVLDKSDAVDLKSHKRKIAEASEVGTAGSSSSGAAGAPPARKPRVEMKFPASVTPEWARELAPPCKGAGLSLDEGRHFRWSAQYLAKADPPRHHTKAFGRHGSEQDRRAAFRVVHEWLWRVHKEETGADCPHVLVD